MKLRLLRGLLMFDAAVLFLLGALLIAVPQKLQAAFHFSNLPVEVKYLLSLWGCLFATLGMGYVVAATDPVRHLIWVQLGVVRGALEFVVGLVYLLRGFVSWQQASFGILVAGFMVVAY